ncbi:Unspecific peroxygenase [Ascochyta rabiei]|uniref:Unspecific peroxygenase n=1 Tax=Didymella rabiei TaxID=5454 RepID=UPI001900F230|nr:Unspecific peroxygenase [Ascochyta rabiei]UPX20943.1 Unspecific peroxygenase [Ascochyta rabiei]
MKSVLVLSTFLGSSTFAFPWLSSDFKEERLEHGLDIISKDLELSTLINDLYQKQVKERDDFFANHNATEECEDAAIGLDKRQSTNCRPHPMGDFFPSTVAGLKKFPEAAYPYQDPKPTDQRGACPGLNTLANHGYIPRTGIVTVAQTIIASAQLFNMGADLTAFLAGGSLIFAGDIPSMTYSIGGADARTNSLGPLGAALGTETGLSGHLRFKEGDASGTRCDFYLCNGDNHNLNPDIFMDLKNQAMEVGGGQYNVKAVTSHFANQYQNSRSKNPYFYFFPPQAALAIGATYFIPGFFSNGTIGAGGVANEASIASFLGASFNDDGSFKSYVPEQIPSQGWYRRAYPMLLSEGIDGIITLYTGAAAQMKNPILFGANTGSGNSFKGGYGLSDFGGKGTFGGTTRKGVACAIQQAVYGNFISEFGNVLNSIIGAVKAVNAAFGSFGCPTPTGAPPSQAIATTFPGYPKPSPCTLNRMQNGLDQCAAGTNTYGGMNSQKIPFCLNSPKAGTVAGNPYPVPVPYPS